ncbi:cancer-related regulator of actin dynamics [Myripristis murdjan]|uniref:cancer-related regulator of actin dynamics n=1 Tax=Myripristis murdjan TaxID=586833 RepID=UPI001175F683|nr:cancer-related regulator of actin dynamics-like [Myripristis murdjan]
MSWFQSLRDDFTLRPFESQRTPSDSAAMASGPPEAVANQEPAEVAEECSGKKKSKFQTFKKFFARKKRKEASATGGDAGLKASQSSDNVSKTPEDNTLTRSEKDKGSGSKISLGSKALSHDSVFVSDSSEANEALGASQDSIHGKVKSLQLQLKQAIRLGSPPSLMCVKRMEDGGTMSEDDGLPCSPPEYSTSHTNQAQTNSSLSLEGTDSDEDQLSCAASSRALSPLVAVPGDFSQPARPFACLDNSAAKHKLGLRQKACNKRKPVSRLEIRAEEDSVVEERLSTAVPKASEEQEEQETRDVRSDQVKPKEEEEEAEEEGEEEEEDEAADQSHSRQTPLRDEEEEEGEEEDELETGQDVSHSPEASSPLERRLSEEEAADAQPLASSRPSSSSSSLGGLRATPEPPAVQREYLLDPPGVAYGTEKARVESDSALGGEEEDGALSDIGGEDGEKESSFLQEVLSSLKTPLTSCSLGLETEDVVLKLDEEAEESKAEVEDSGEVEEEKEGMVAEEGEEATEEETEEEKPTSHQAPPSGLMPLLSGQPTHEEDVLSEITSSSQGNEKEENYDDEEEEDEEVVVERFQHRQEDEWQREEAQEVMPEYSTKEEENSLFLRKSGKEEGEEAESEGEEETGNLEREPEVEEEEWEQREDDEEEEEREELERAEEAQEAEEAVAEEEDNREEMTNMVPDEIGEMVQTVMPALEADEGQDTLPEEDSAFTPEQPDRVQIHAEMCDQTENETAPNQNFVDEDGEERAEECIEIGQMEETSDQEEDLEMNQPDVDQSEEAGVATDQPDEDQEMSQLVVEDQRDIDQTDVDLMPPSVSAPDSQASSETRIQEESETSVPSPTSPTTSTTTLHINLVSPSSEKATCPLQQFFSGADTTEEVNQSSSHTEATAEQDETRQPPIAEQPAETAEEEEEEEKEEEEGKQSPATIEEAQPSKPPAAAEEAVTQPSSVSDQGKSRFIIAPAWQRSFSTGSGSTKEPVASPSPSSPPPCVSSCVSSSPSATGPGGAEGAASTKKVEGVSSAKAEVVLSPVRTRSIGSAPAKPHSTTTAVTAKPQTSTAAAAEESAVVVEGNPENPFGVRLRKTAVLRRYSSEEENTEPASPEPPAQPSGSKVEPQPVSVKPSINQPVNIKPAIPRKPEVHGDSGGKIKRPDPAASRSVSAGSDSPSWISVARQKQKIYKDSSLDAATAKKEEPERKSSLPLYVSSAACREHNKTSESTGKVSQLEITKPAASAEKEVRRTLSPPTPVPPQPAKSQPLPCPVASKLSSQVTPATPKYSSQIALSPPTPVPISQRAPSCTSPTPPSKIPQPQSTQSSSPTAQKPSAQPSSALPSPPFSSRSGLVPPRAASQPSQRGLPSPGSPPPALSQDEPPWMALAKKKAKAWSEMPQIVQ